MGILINGKYYRDESLAPETPMPALASQAKQFSAEQQLRQYDREVIQPYLKNGDPNPDFIKYYPAEAREYGMLKEDNE